MRVGQRGIEYDRLAGYIGLWIEISRAESSAAHLGGGHCVSTDEYPLPMNGGRSTLSNIDTTRAARTPDELRELVEAIHSSPEMAQETNWLEWKSSLDLSKPAGRFAVAKAILGFANRAVGQAHLACDGVAYMVVGVEPGTAAGVEPMDHAHLSHALKPYVTTARWTPHYVPYEGVTVLVVVVEAPRAGDPIHTLQKTYNDGKKHNAAAGTIFCRGAAQSEPAGVGEIEMLGKRWWKVPSKPP